MSNVFHKNCRYFQLPTELVESGALSKLRPSAVKLMVAICFFAQNHSAVQLELANEEISRYTGLDPGSIESARKQLEHNGLVTLKKGPLGVYRYILLNPQTRQPLTPPPNKKGVRRYSPRIRKIRGTTEFDPMSSSESGRSQEPDHTTHQVKVCTACGGQEFWLNDAGERVCESCEPKEIFHGVPWGEIGPE